LGLEVVNLTAKVGDKIVLRNVSLTVNYGEVHAIMGPNGSGKSSLAYVIMGRPIYEVLEGDILLDGESIKDLPPEERALKGIFMAQQDPPQVPGVRLSSLIITFTNKRLGAKDLTRPKDPRILRRMYEVADKIGLPRELLQREVNVGFSGGEKKRSELLQAILFDPKIVILDEPDSGLDIDGLKVVAEYIKAMRDSGKGVMLITHYARLLNYVRPDRVTVLLDGRVAATGGPELANLVEEKGYAYLRAKIAKGGGSTSA
jgi:Fe-S cluster assembly ATP-binding protein